MATVMSNLGLRKYAESNDIHFEATKVGDRYVLENMLANALQFRWRTILDTSYY